MVKLRPTRSRWERVAADLVLVPLAEGDVPGTVRRLGGKLAARLGRRLRDGVFRGRSDEVLLHHDERAVALLGLGGAPIGTDAWRRAGARGRQEAERHRARRVVVALGGAGESPEVLAAFVEGFLLAGYRFARYLSGEDGRRRVESLVLASETMPRAARSILDGVEAVVGEVFRARDLVNEPASVKTPRYLADQTEALADEIPGLQADVWDVDRIRQERLNGLLAVARGTVEEPRFIMMRWTGPNARHRVALVGKAITFDSGGLSLKPPKSMETMKYDMAGGAAVLGTVAAAARLGLAVDVAAYVPATENLPGERAQKPGDIIRYRTGKTVEVLNTDAEGRLILADALGVARRIDPHAIIDLATLTGACRVALGNALAGLLGNDQRLLDRLLEAGRTSGEQVWQLPLVPEYREDLKSPVADLKNVGGEAGTIVAALFLQEFVDGTPWAHLDIAGPAFTEKDLPHAARGGTGFGIRLLIRYLRELAAS